MAIAPNGTKQKTYCVREDLARIIAMIASRHDRRESDVVSDALDAYVKRVLSDEEKRVYGYRSETQGENVNGQGKRADKSGAPPGSKKRSRVATRVERRTSKRESGGARHVG